MRIYLAGMESNDAMPMIKEGLVKNAFFSYYYMRDKGVPQILIDRRPFIESIIIDSGAHTFFSELAEQGLSVSVHKKKTKTKEDPDVYFNRYLEWVKEYWNYFDYFVELDIGEIVTQKKVLEWRDRLKKENVYKKCITVFHPAVVTWKDYLAMLDDSESKYVAVEGDRAIRKRLPYDRLISQAHKRGIKVHGFAFTKKEALYKYPFYSVDSTSWKAGTQYGASRAPDGNSSTSVRFKKPSESLYALSRFVPKLVEAYDKVRRNQREKRLEIAVRAYNEMEEYFSGYWKKKGVSWTT